MSTLVVGYVPGVSPKRWFRIWTDRQPRISLEGIPMQDHEAWDALSSAQVRMAFVRLAPAAERPEGLHLIPLYEERPVVVVPKDHVVTAFDEVTADDIAEEMLELPDSMPWRDRVAVVAGGAGLSVVPQSVARDFQRKDLAWRPVIDLPPTRVGLAWLREDPGVGPDPLVEEFIGIVRGRTAQSSRGDSAPSPQKTRKARRGR